MLSSNNQRMGLGLENTFLYSIKETQESGATLNTNLKAGQLDANQDALQKEAENNHSALAIANKHKNLKLRSEESKLEKVKRVESVLVRKEEADSFAEHFSKREENQRYISIGLDPKLLSQLAYEELGRGITDHTPPDEIITLVRQRMMSVDGAPPAAIIVDKALEFLLKMTEKKIHTFQGEEKTRLTNIQHQIEAAKKTYESLNEVELRLTPELVEAADTISQSTKESIRETFDRCREIVHQPPDLQALRKYYEEKGYKAMVLELKGLSAYLGGNFKRKNLDNPELAQLASAAKKMQALLGVFRQSKIYLSSMESYLELSGMLEAA